MTAISVIIPARDAEQTLAVTLESLVAQEFPDWEAIIVDDGSTDGTAEVAAGFVCRDSRIRCIGTPGLGLAAARNRGFERADGEAVLFLDSDDWVGRGHLTQLVAALRADDTAAASYCGYVRVTPSGQAFLPRYSSEIAIAPMRVFAVRNRVASHSVLIRRQQVERLNGFDEALRTCEDWDLWQRLAFEGARFAPVPGLHAYYRLREGSLSANVGQLYSDGARIIGNGVQRLASAFPGSWDPVEEEAFAVAEFALWCRGVAAGQRNAAHTDPLPLPPVTVEREKPEVIAQILLEALSTGACRTPASFAHNWRETEALLLPLLDAAVASDVHDEVRSAFARLLGVDPDRPKNLVSVVIPAYRAMDTVEETLRSVRSQTHEMLDIVLVDDGSPDATADIVLSHAARDARLSVIQQANAGVATARNTGWRAAAGDYIAFVDADDLWAPTKIEKQLDALCQQGEEAGLAYTWYAKIDGESRIVSRGHNPRAEGNVLSAIFEGNFVGNGSAALMTRAALETANGFDASLRARGAQGCEDYAIYFRIAENHRFALVPELLTGYREIPGNMSSDMLRMLRSFNLVAQEMLARHPECRSDIARGRAKFMLWSLITAAERGDLAVAAKLAAKLGRHSPRWLALSMLWQLPRALTRGVRLRVAGRPRRRRDYSPKPFVIGRIDGEPA